MGRIKGFLLGILYFILVPVVVLAAPGNPASITIGDVAVFRNVLSTGDQLWFMRYDANYASVPSEDPEDTYLMAIYGTDGTTLLFTQPVHYYQHNIISIYLSPTQALTWEGAYVVRIMGNPAVFDPLVEGLNMRSRTLGAGDYYEQTVLGGYMITQAGILEDDWSITLLTSGDLLNTTGATYFNKAVPGLSSMAPDIYQVTTEYPTVTKYDWNHTYEEELLARRGESLNETFSGLGDFLGTSNQWMATGSAGFLCILVGGGVFAATKKPDWAMIFAAITTPFCVWIGVVTLNVWWIIGFIILLVFGIAFLMGKLT